MALKKTGCPTLHPDLAQVALVDARTAAAAGGMGTSWWAALVQSGDAPQPVVKSHRCTRWRTSDVVSFWRGFAENGLKPALLERLAANAKKSQAAMQRARQAAPAASAQRPQAASARQAPTALKGVA